MRLGITQPSDRSDLLRRYRCFATCDLDEARDLVGKLWEQHRSHKENGRRYFLCWHVAALSETTLSYARTSNRIHVSCAPVSDCYSVTLHEAGRITHQVNGGDAVSTPGNAVLHAPGQELELSIEPYRLLLLRFDGVYLRTALAQRSIELRLGERWPLALSLQTPPGRALKAVVRWLAEELDRPPRATLTSFDALPHVEVMLRTLFLDALEVERPGSKSAREDPTERRVKRVEAFIDAHFAEPLGLEDLARVSCCSTRALQSGFRRYRGSTPIEALLRRRLHAARELLVGAANMTVTRAATQAGFSHLGRFAEQYRRAFGETPSATLGRRSGDRGQQASR